MSIFQTYQIEYYRYLVVQKGDATVPRPHLQIDSDSVTTGRVLARVVWIVYRANIYPSEVTVPGTWYCTRCLLPIYYCPEQAVVLMQLPCGARLIIHKWPTVRRNDGQAKEGLRLPHRKTWWGGGRGAQRKSCGLMTWYLHWVRDQRCD